MRKVFEDYGPRAARAGVALVTAMGFDYAPGDMIAALTAEGMEPLDEIVLAYAVRGFGATRGTALSASGDDEPDGAVGVARRRAGFGAAERRRRELGLSGPDRPPADAAVPGRRAHHRAAARPHAACADAAHRLDRDLAAARTARIAPLVHAPRFNSPCELRFAGRLAAAIPRLPEGPSESSRRRASFTVVCEARQGSKRRSGNRHRQRPIRAHRPRRPPRERFVLRRPATTAEAPWRPRRRSTRATSWTRSATSASSTRSSEHLPGVRGAAVRVAAGGLAGDQRQLERLGRARALRALRAGKWPPGWRRTTLFRALLASARELEDGKLELRVANRDSVQASPRWPPLGSARFRTRDLPDPQSLRGLAAAAGLARRGGPLPPSGARSQAWMWQTLLNALTFEENFAHDPTPRPQIACPGQAGSVRHRRHGEHARPRSQRCSSRCRSS